jgi:hypothetical protein
MVAPGARWQPGGMKSIHLSPVTTELEDRAFYVESSVPAGVTLDEYRRGRRQRLSRWGRLKRLAGAGAAPAPA